MYEELNGAFTLTFTSYSHNDNPGHNLIMQEGLIEYDGYKFRVKQLRKLTNSTQVSCISSFYENADVFKYDTYGGSHTLSEFVTYVLGGTGWTWVAENIDVNHYELIPNFGQNNVIQLMEILKVIFQFEVRIDRGKQITISSKVGPDNDSQYRYGHNMMALTETIDTTKLKTYVEGFGANALHVTYTSPYASNPGIGIRHAEPVYDDSYTDSETFLKYLASELHDYPDSIIELGDVSLMDKTIGERVWVIHERMGIEYQTRVVAKRTKIPSSLSSVTLGTYKPQSRSLSNELIEQKLDMDKSNTINRSRFDQTESRITLEVSRLDGADSLMNANLTIQADRITSEVSSRQQGDTDTYNNSVSYIEQTATSIRSEVSTQTARLDGRIDSNSSLISQSASEILLRVRKDGVISSINQTAEVIRITASKIDLQGAVTITDLNPSVGSKITRLDSNGIYTGTVNADNIIGGTIRGVTVSVDTDLTIGNNIYLKPSDPSASKSIVFTSGGRINFGANNMSIQSPQQIDLSASVVSYNGATIATQSWASANIVARFG
jgi:hypothetical protein